MTANEYESTLASLVSGARGVLTALEEARMDPAKAYTLLLTSAERSSDLYKAIVKLLGHSAPKEGKA